MNNKFKYLFYYLDIYNFIHINDKKYLELLYDKIFHKQLNLGFPQTFNEKLQWLKLYDRKDIYTTMVDKYEAKKYVANIIGEEFIIPTLGIYDSFNEIEFDKFPNQFVIKCTHDSGGLVIVEDKDELNIKSTKKKINKCLKKNYYYAGREWPYKNVQPRIIVEQYMKDDNSDDLKDYKFFCFNGKVGTILVCSNRNGSFKNTDFYDTNWKKMPFARANHTGNPNGNPRPSRLNEMVEIAEKLSKDIPFVRVDLYDINDKVYFGELTFYPSSGFEGFLPEEYDKILGDMLILPKEKKNEE